MSVQDNSYRVVIETELDDQELFIEFDKVDEVPVESNSDITTHPLVNGDTIADHMYRTPVTMSINGSFSLSGYKPTVFPGGSSDRLNNIEDTFERIKNEGKFCTITKMNRNEKDSFRFKRREQMVLRSIRFVEKQNSLDVSLSFNEVMTANVLSIIPQIDVRDPNLPAITDASTLDFTDTLLDWKQVDSIVLSVLNDEELITSEFLQFAVTTVSNSDLTLTGGGIGLAAGVLVGIQVLKVIALASGSIPGVGWLIAGGIAVAGCIVGLIVGAVKAAKRKDAQKKYKTEVFKLYKDDRKNQSEVIRFANYVGTIHQHLEYLENVIQVYGIGSNENQECMLYIDDSYYVFTFMKDNNTGYYKLTVTSPSTTENLYEGEAQPLSNIGECTRNNKLFRTVSGGFYVYFINLKYEEAVQKGMSNDELNELSKDLTNCAIVVCQTDMESFTQLLTDVIKNAMTM